MNFFNKNATRVLSIVLLIALSLLLLSSCGDKDTTPSREEIIAKMNGAEQPSYNTSLQYLSYWGLSDTGLFYNTKFKSIEKTYRTDYYKADELPTAEALARLTAELYLERFFDKIDAKNDRDVSDALISCYVASIGDDYSIYRTATEDDEYTTDMSGTFVGIGVSIIYNHVNNTITVEEVYHDSGAYDAGILPGDLIVGADGKTLEELGHNKLINAIRGEEGTRVKVSLIRNGTPIELDVQRKKVVEKTISYNISTDGIGYIKITSFKDNTAEQFCKAVDELKEKNVKAVIYDLRSNGGGYLHSVVEMLSYIAPNGTQITSFSNNYASPIYATGEHTFLVPSVVLCNEYTASAGELFTSAIRDFGKMELLDATLVGTNTFGKGIMQSGISFIDGSSLTYTVCYYNAPLGENYHGKDKGIKPDVEIALTEEGDVQLDKAYELARVKLQQ